MGKLTEKQTNILYIGIGVVVLLVFSVLIYFQYEKNEELNQGIEQKQKEKEEATKKQRSLPKMIADLWKMQQKYEYFKKVLPSNANDEFTKFYDTIDAFRSDRGIKGWKYLRTKEIESLGQVDKNDGKPQKVDPTKRPTGPFVETFYQGSIPLTFDQLGQMLNFIENYERFCGVQEIQVSSPTASKDGGETESMVNLTLVSYSYGGSQPLDDDIQAFIKDFGVPPDLQKEVDDLKNKDWGRKERFVWTKPMRDPFEKEKVVGTEITQGKKTKEGEEIVKPHTADVLDTEIKTLQDTQKFLHMLAVAENWVELQNALIDRQYEKNLMNLKITKKNDPTGAINTKVLEMQRELKVWKQSIQEADRQKRASQLVMLGRKKIKEMEDLYEKGKKNGSQKDFNDVLTIHNEFMPQFREFGDLEKATPGLETLRKRMETLNSKAETQIKIIQLADKLVLKGVIYIPNRPELSVAFINEKVVKKNDILVMGFVVHEIQEEGVVLRYKEETVPIRLKRLIAKPELVKKHNPSST